MKIRLLKSMPLFVFLLPIFFVLHGYTENFHLINEIDCLLLLTKYCFVTTLFTFIFFFVFRSWRTASVFVFLLLSFHFFFGSIHDAAKSIIPNSFLVKYTVILPFVLVVFSIAFFYFKKTKQQFYGFTKFTNVLFLILILFDAVQLTTKALKKTRASQTISKNFLNCDTCNKPDIYFIIADEYAGKQELKDIFHFNNLDFEKVLLQKGFYIIDSSVSNYNYTPFSAASILSMNYLTGIEGKNRSKTDRHICYSLINKNPVCDFLRSQGYVLKNYSIFQFNNELPAARSSFILTGQELLTSQTFLSRLDRDIRFNLVSRFKLPSQMTSFANAELNSVQYLFTKTKEESEKQSSNPRFIYTHLMMPHYPYLFDKNGNRTNPEIVLEGSQVLQKEYIDYLQYSNTKFLELIDHILSHSKKPPVIIFMSDHGFRHFTKEVDHKYYFMNFNAVYLPNKNYQQFYTTLSAVNEFRVLFNSQFNQHLPLLKDSTSFFAE